MEIDYVIAPFQQNLHANFTYPGEYRSSPSEYLFEKDHTLIVVPEEIMKSLYMEEKHKNKQIDFMLDHCLITPELLELTEMLAFSKVANEL